MKELSRTKTLVHTEEASRVGLWIALVMLSLILMLPARLTSAAEDPETYMKTVGGVLQVEDSRYQRRLLFNGKPVTYISDGRRWKLEDDFVVLQKRYTVKNNDVVMLYTNCSGTACGGSSMVHFVTITPQGKITVSEGIITSSEEGLDADEVKLVGDSLEFSSITFISPRKYKTERWVLLDGKLERRK